MTRLSVSSFVFVSGLALAGLAGCAGGPERVYIASGDQAAAGISVSGTGEVNARPDIGRMSLGVEARATTAEQAMNEASTKMAAVLAALKSAGIVEKDLRTNRVSVYHEFQPTPPAMASAAPMAAPASAPLPKGAKAAPVPPAPPPPAAPPSYEVFHASNTVEVTVRDLDKAGAIISAATRAGSNEIGGIDFTIEDPKPIEEKAREKAVADARARAEQLAKLAGVTLGPVLSIQESGGGGYYPAPMAMMKSAAADAPVERGELKVTRQVQVRFAIAK
jgi:uncharacterized protein YggE